ncbi:hypothetical protein B0H17DRAFT_1206463 [Mycena rosella]|uniref:Uncharacterized protein n=1 Tax=Mycena rosella TaxID=1033263 RepID=A0AAD7D5G4_MYCRO|nr:hypothetical protein B0H17DRAFT_1206463 [Mycena rosella]
MALHKLGDDEWTASGVKSTFTITMPEDPASQISVSPTAICGWGWRFSCSIDPASNTTSPILMNSDSDIIPWRRVTVFFHPDLIRQADYGRITFLTHVKNLLPLDNEIFYKSLTCLSLDMTGQFLSWRVGGSCVVRPRAMYAKMALLRGHSGDLDAYLDGISSGAGFTESARVDLDQDLFEERFTGYDYMSDSDLDSAEEEEDGVQAMNASQLAEAFGLNDLKSLALTSLRSQLSPNNIVHEAFSSFTSVYPEIQEIEVAFLILHLPDLMGDIDKILASDFRSPENIRDPKLFLTGERVPTDEAWGGFAGNIHAAWADFSGGGDTKYATLDDAVKLKRLLAAIDSSTRDGARVMLD